MSATYIPHAGDSFGVGVGIPGLSSFDRVDSEFSAGSDFTEREMRTPGTGLTTPMDDGPKNFFNERQYPPQQASSQYGSRPPTATPSGQQSSNTPSGGGLQHAPSILPSQGTPGLTPAQIESAKQWPIDNVLTWLAQNQFSNDWQETFKALDIHGTAFLELGSGHGGRGNFGMMHQQVYPRLAKECSNSGTGWDQSREREEGKRMRRLIRDIANGRTSRSAHGRRESGANSANPNASQESFNRLDSTSPNMTRENYVTSPSTANPDDESPHKQMFMPQSPGGANLLGKRRTSQNRSLTMPNYSGSQYGNNDSAHRNFMKNIDTSDHRGNHSPTVSTDLSEKAHFMGAELRQENSPKSGSPSTSFASYLPNFYSGKLSASPHATSFGHRASTSTDSVASNAMFAGRRHAHDGARPSPNEDANGGKEKSGFLKHFKRKKKEEGGHGMFPSPQEDNLESPTSPAVSFKPPYLQNERAVASETSLPGSTFSATEYDKFQHTPKKQPGTSKLYVLATTDGWNFRLCDITDAETPLEVRQSICHSWGIQDVVNSHLYITELGRTGPEHQEPLDDTRLIVSKRMQADAKGNLKIYLYNPNPAAHLPQSTPATIISSKGRLDVEVPRQRSNSSPPSSRQNTLSKASAVLGVDVSMAEAADTAAFRERMGHFAPLAVDTDRERRQAAERKDSGNKKKDLSIRGLSVDDDGSADRSPGIVGRKVDFDKPRQSPFEDKKTDQLFPQRRPPPPPAESATLIKANSLSKKSAQRAGLGPQNDRRPNLGNLADRAKTFPRQESGEPPRKASPGLSGGIGAALVGMGQHLTSVGQPSPSLTPPASFPSQQGWDKTIDTKRAMTMVDFNTQQSGRSSPRSSHAQPGGITWGKGDQPFVVPDYKSGENNNMTDNGVSVSAEDAAIAKFRQEEMRRAASPVDMSPTSAKPQGGPGDRRSYGPTSEFTEAAVSFAQTPAAPQMDDDSDDDSDDGLFAIPLAKKTEDKNTGPEHSDNDKRPTLTLNTKPATTRAKKGVSFGEDSFRAPSTSDSPQWNRHPQIMPDIDEDAAVNNRRDETWLTASQLQNPELRVDEVSSARSGKGRRNPTSALSEPYSANSLGFSAGSEDLRRRESFARQDVWANRPPAEALIDHLDDFFPNLDLDQPVLEADANGVSPPPSPTSATPGVGGVPQLPPPTSVPDGNPESYYNDADTLGSDESTLKTLDQQRTSLQSVAQRNVRRSGASGGLGRMKSIREVAKSAHDANKRYTQRQSGASGTSNAGLLRRKSTKMFGANIVQIKPQRGSMVLPQIPQDRILQENGGGLARTSMKVKRQATFRWFKGQLIGKGTYGRVYLGMNATTGDFLAVKQVEVSKKAAGGDREKMRELVKALDLEIDTMKDLDHVNIVQYLGCERRETSISIFLEYISGGSVGSCLRKHGKFEEAVVSSLTRQTLSGLAYLHSKGILHRDLKADNILLDLDGSCKISDFGISKKSDNIYGNDASNSMQGSVFWMAPEVVRARGLAAPVSNAADGGPEGKAVVPGGGYSAKVDIWSLGCVVLEMFAGRRPWSKEEAVGAIYKLGMLGERPPLPEDVEGEVSVLAVGFMADCFETDPGERPTADTLLNQHPFCAADPNYNFLDTDLYAKIRGAY